MRALIKTAHGVGNLEILETAAPTPGPGEALVRIGPSGLCGTDLLLYDDVYRGRKRPVPCPLIVGHEASGEVVELGLGTSWPPPGTRVGIEAVTGCGHCYHCLRGNYNQVRFIGQGHDRIHIQTGPKPVLCIGKCGLQMNRTGG